MSPHAEIVVAVHQIVDSHLERDEALVQVCDCIQSTMPKCDWVGFYLIDPTDESTLVLGPFLGEPTDHVRIPIGRGICGQAVERGETIVVPDVTAESNYLACSIDVKSEIVVPIRVGARIVGELDIDSHTLNAFSSDDRVLLEGVCEIVSDLFLVH